MDNKLQEIAYKKITATVRTAAILGVVIFVIGMIMGIGIKPKINCVCHEAAEISELSQGIEYEVMNNTAVWVHGRYHVWIYSEERDVVPVKLTRTENYKLPATTKFMKDRSGRIQIIK